MHRSRGIHFPVLSFHQTTRTRAFTVEDKDTVHHMRYRMAYWTSYLHMSGVHRSQWDSEYS